MSEMDIEASRFAMCLLMPEHLMRVEHAKWRPKYDDGERLVKKMAERFKVPLAAMWIRLGELGLEVPI